ncbi:putative quinol monooxygenase [Alphaproteobacteria bacterium LSUCC0684]
MYVVTVSFEINPESVDDFMRLMRAQAVNSRRLEDGCHQFDIAYEANQPDHIFLYELYRDRVAFDLHLESAHYQEFAAQVESMIVKKIVNTFDTHEAGH